MSFHVRITCADWLRQPGQTDARLSGTVGQVPGAAAETSPGTRAPHVRVPGCESWLHSQPQLPARVHPGSQRVMVESSRVSVPT